MLSLTCGRAPGYRARAAPCSAVKRSTGSKKANLGLLDLARRLFKLAGDSDHDEHVRREKEMFAAAARNLQGVPAVLVDLQRRVKTSARGTSLIIAQTARVLQYSATLYVGDVPARFELWTTGGDIADSLATDACQEALDTQMLFEGVTLDSLGSLLRQPRARERLDDEPDEAAPAAGSDASGDVPDSSPDVAFCDCAPGERSPGGSQSSGMPDAEPDALLPCGSGAPDGGAPAMSVDE